MFCVVCVRYEMVRRGALASGARAGPVAMVVYSCTGRGKSIFGEEAASGEAHIADEVSRQGSWASKQRQVMHACVQHLCDLVVRAAAVRCYLVSHLRRAAALLPASRLPLLPGDGT